MNFAVNHAPGAGSIAEPDDQQSCMQPVCYGHPRFKMLWGPHTVLCQQKLLVSHYGSNYGLIRGPLNYQIQYIYNYI